jgi:hypothetical protein
VQTKLEKQILNETKGLPESAMDEVLHFIRFIKLKWQQKKTFNFSDNLTAGLSEMEKEEWQHLESEMKDYKKLFPRAK